MSGNVYTGHRADPDDFAAGILFFISNPYLGQGGITIGSGNTITANEFGIWTNDPRTLTTTSLAGVSGNTRNAVAYFSGGYAGQGPLLEYPAWAASSAAAVSAASFGGKQSGDIVDVGGALRVTGWSGFTAIQPAIDAVAAGGSVSVGSGSYAESVVLNGLRNLAFSGTTIEGLTINSGAAGSGISGGVTASGPTGFLFNAPVRLLGDTSLAASAGSITMNGDIQGSYALSLRASGDITLLSGGSEASPLGMLTAASSNFTLSGTLWVTGYDIDALGYVALSGHTLNSIGGPGTINADGPVTGATHGDSPLYVQSDVSVDIIGSAPSLIIDAPHGSVNGSFGEVTNVGLGVIDVNGKPAAERRARGERQQQPRGSRGDHDRGQPGGGRRAARRQGAPAQAGGRGRGARERRSARDRPHARQLRLASRRAARGRRVKWAVHVGQHLRHALLRHLVRRIARPRLRRGGRRLSAGAGT